MIFKLPKKKKYYDGETVVERKFLLLPRVYNNHVYWLTTVTITKQATNMYYEAGEWISWSVINVTVDK